MLQKSGKKTTNKRETCLTMEDSIVSLVAACSSEQLTDDDMDRSTNLVLRVLLQQHSCPNKTAKMNRRLRSLPKIG